MKNKDNIEKLKTCMQFRFGSGSKPVTLSTSYMQGDQFSKKK